MATAVNTTASVSPNVPVQAPVPELPPALAAFIQALRPTIHILIVSAVWLGIAIPILVTLFFTSTKKLRRSGIFISNAIAICIGITMGVLNVTIQTQGMLNPIKGLSRPEVIAYTFIASSAGVYIDCILLFRVIVVFPRTTTPPRMWFAIITPLAMLKLARFVNLVIFMNSFVVKTRSINSSAAYQPLARSLVGTTIEWSLQLVDNALCSSLFLWRLNQAQSFSEKSNLSLRKSSYYKALGDLFWIATTNFVFPCLFDIVMFVLFYRDPDGTHYLIVLISNVYVQIIGVLFATIWRATHEISSKTVEGSDLPRTQELSLEFAQNRTVHLSNGTTTTVTEDGGIELSSRKANFSKASL